MQNRSNIREHDSSSYAQCSHSDQADASIETEYPNGYQIYMHHFLGIIGGVFAVCWWFFLAYMVIVSRKDGIAAHVIAYGFLIGGLLFVVYILGIIVRSKFTVKGTTITRYFVLSKPKTYHINEITKVVVHHAKGSSYRIYIGKKKIFTLDNTMVNLGLFIETLQRNNVQFKTSVF